MKIVMEKMTDKKRINFLIMLMMFAYTVSYITRINLGSVVQEICTAENIAKSALSLCLTGSFITYGAGQIISGYIGDKIQPKYLVFIGFIVSSTMNILIPFCPNTSVMVAVWCINGLAQAFMWPPIVRLMSSTLSAKDYSRACVVVSWGSSFGTIIVYLTAPAVISLSGWKPVFFISAFLGILMSVLWITKCPKIDKETPVKKEKNTEKKTGTFKLLFNPIMICVMLGIILQGSLRDGVTTWMPSFISETFNLSNEISILSGVILPVFSIISFQISSVLYKKVFTNPVACAGVIFAFGAGSAFLLYLLSDKNAVASILLSALLTACMHGVNLMLICMIPNHFGSTGKVSLISGTLNACTYIGSAISTYGTALLAENAGWNRTILIWMIIAVCGTAVCIASAKGYRKRYMNI